MAPRPDDHPIQKLRGLDRPAVVLTGEGGLEGAKTAHGLLRRSRRFDLVGVLDPARGGSRSTDVIADGVDVPVVSSIRQLDAVATAVVGVSPTGGRMTPQLRAQILEALRAGLDVVNTLHDLTADDSELRALADDRGCRLVDLRAPRRVDGLRRWTGEALHLPRPPVIVIGTDCSSGKRTSTWLLEAACRRAGLPTEVVATGQTGVTQGALFGFQLDATPIDFVGGELEGEVLRAAATEPDLVLIAGQSALRHPGAPVGAELLLPVGVRRAVLQHVPGRRFYQHTSVEVPDVADDLLLAESYGVEVVAVALGGQGLNDEELSAERDKLEGRLGVRVVCPLVEGVDAIVPLLV
jgi:uncharacterized NAD-dependent epimerase/dehydratase family protein